MAVAAKLQAWFPLGATCVASQSGQRRDTERDLTRVPQLSQSHSTTRSAMTCDWLSYSVFPASQQQNEGRSPCDPQAGFPMGVTSLLRELSNATDLNNGHALKAGPRVNAAAPAATHAKASARHSRR